MKGMFYKVSVSVEFGIVYNEKNNGMIYKKDYLLIT